MERSPLDGILELLKEIKKCEQADATTAALAMAYICLDTMAFLALPAGATKQGRQDFIAWVDAFLKAHVSQPYQYRGMDVYGARCALLHAYASETDYHQKYPDAVRFAYHDGGQHFYDPAVEPRLVLIGTASFLNDVMHAVGEFLNACRTDKDLQERVFARVPAVLATFPFFQVSQ